MARDPEAIAHEIEVTRAQMAQSIDALAEKLSPKRVAARGKERARVLTADAQAAIVASTKTTMVGADGQTYEVRKPLRTDRVAAVGGALTAAAVLLVVVRRRRRRRATVALLATRAAVGRGRGSDRRSRSRS